MVSRYRNSPPPYELMSTGSAPAHSPGPVASVSGAIQGAPTSSSLIASWWAKVQQPVVWRVPWGLMILLCVALIGLIVMAYWVGLTRGARFALAQETDTNEPRGNTPNQAVAVMGTLPEIAKSDTTAGARQTEQRTGLREVGLNYFVLAHYPRADAERLVSFLNGNGIDAAAFRLHNKDLFQVVALYGLSRDKIYSPARKEFEQQMRHLGRQWKAEGHGPDFSTTGIYLDLYEGEPIAETIK